MRDFKKYTLFCLFRWGVIACHCVDLRRTTSWFGLIILWNITTIGSTNLHLLIQIQFLKREKKGKKVLVMRTLRIYCYNHFPVCRIAVFTTVTMWSIPSIVLTYLITGDLYLWPIPPFPCQELLIIQENACWSQ